MTDKTNQVILNTLQMPLQSFHVQLNPEVPRRAEAVGSNCCVVSADDLNGIVITRWIFSSTKQGSFTLPYNFRLMR